MDKPRICEVLGDEFEKICEAVHNEWWEEKKRQGIDDHPDMLPYQELPENVKEYDRVTVRLSLIHIYDQKRKVRMEPKIWPERLLCGQASTEAAEGCRRAPHDRPSSYA